MLDQRGRLLRAALGFAALPRPSYDRALWALRTWLDSWAGIGRIAVGIAHQGYDPWHATQRAAWEALRQVAAKDLAANSEQQIACA